MIDYNKKYKFISDGTWFKKGTECIIEDGNCLWDLDGKVTRKVEISYETMMEKPDRISGIFQGIRISENSVSELHRRGEEYEDGEVCTLDEFEIIKR